MNYKFAFRTFLLFLLCFAAHTAPAGEYDILYDVSGSMAGFQAQAESWRNFLAGLESHAKSKFRFGEIDHFGPIQGTLFDEKPRDNNTFLGEAIQSWLNLANDRSDLVLVITDNVADTQSGESSSSQALLTRLLSRTQGQFDKVAIITFQMPFDGDVYYLQSNAKNHYSGSRALVLYLLGTNPGNTADPEKQNAEDAFFRVRDDTIAHLQQFDHAHELFQIIPYDLNQTEIGRDFIDLGQGITFNQNQGIEIRGYSLKEPLEFRLKTTIMITGSFELKGINLKANIELPDLPHHLVSTQQGGHQQGFTAKVINPAKNLKPHEPQDIEFAFKIEPFDFENLGLFEKLSKSLKNSEAFKGYLNVIFNARKENYEISQDVIQKWDYSERNEQDAAERLGDADQAVQSRIYHLNEVVIGQALPDRDTEPKISKIPITLHIQYPIGPMLLLIGLLIGVIALIWLIWSRIGGHKQNYRLVDELGTCLSLSTSLGAPFTHIDELTNQPLFTIRFIGIGFWVSSRLAFSGAHFLSEGDRFTITEKNADQSTWELKQVASEEPSHDEDRDAYEEDRDFRW
ncbi:MAG: hypothetical protein ACRER2_14665 [Methylococcales bacterium]